MALVVDASVALKWVLDEPDSHLAQVLAEDDEIGIGALELGPPGPGQAPPGFSAWRMISSVKADMRSLPVAR